MFKCFAKWLFGTTAEVNVVKRKANSIFSTAGNIERGKPRGFEFPKWPELIPINEDGTEVATTDSADEYENALKPNFGGFFGGISEVQLSWYASQSFVGYQVCALLAQNWFIEKACRMPAEDAVRKGYKITVNDGTKVETDVLDFIKKCDKAYGLTANMIEWIRFGKIFGIRMALFVVESPDPDYYKNPFNIDGVMPGSYKGISQIDPYWMAPQLISASTLEPGNMHFYEPEYWRVGSKTIHRSHFITYTTGKVADVMKPAYNFGGVSVPQKIYERVYAAERTANEAPQLAMTKRLITMKTDLAEALANQRKFDERMVWWTEAMNNYAVKLAGEDDEIQQFDISLTDLDTIIMTQYQIACAIAEVPSTRMLGTQPKGLSATGEYDEASYHETLESLQSNDLQRFVERHHMLVIKSRVMPKFKIAYFETMVEWNELDAMTAAEQAAVNLVKAQTAAQLATVGSIEAQDDRDRLVNDPDSGYSGMSAELPPMPDSSDIDPVTGQPIANPAVPGQTQKPPTATAAVATPPVAPKAPAAPKAPVAS